MAWRGLAALALFVAAAQAAGAAPPKGYIYPEHGLHIEAWLPAAPADNSMAKAADVETYFSTRALIGTARADEAHADDVAPSPAENVAPRFDYLLGIKLTRGNAPQLLHLMDGVRADALSMVEPVKKDVGAGGRHRPFVDYPQLPKCEVTYAALPQSGSYPSGHSIIGWLWGTILAELVPEHADEFIARGVAFGDSRVVCGFHYPSDVTAGRLAAAALLARLHADAQFQRDLAAARKELNALLAPARK